MFSWTLIAGLLIGCEGDGAGDSGAGDLEIAELGSFTTGDTGGYTGDVAFEVPKGAASAVVHCGGFGDDTLGALWSLTNPGGSLDYDGDAPSSTPFRADFLDARVPVLHPITPDLDITSGAYTANFWIGGGARASVDCQAIYRLDEPGATANLSVDLVFVGLEDLDASSAPDDPDFQAALAQFETEWGTGGLAPSYTYSDFGGDAATYAVIDVSGDDYSEFNDLLRTADPANSRALTIFFVQEFSIDGADVLGLSAGPPGAATVQGTSKSGLVVSTLDLRDAPENVGKIMAHEGGHFLGLYHTSEKDGGTHDPISDTPQCTDDGGDGTVNTADCEGSGAENVMWWTLTGAGAAELSDDQGWVVRRSPAAR